MWLNSTPMAPAPRMIAFFGSFLSMSAPVEESTLSSSNSKPGMIRGREPVATTMFFPVIFFPSLRVTSFFPESAASPVMSSALYFFRRKATPLESASAALRDLSNTFE